MVVPVRSSRFRFRYVQITHISQSKVRQKRVPRIYFFFATHSRLVPSRVRWILICWSKFQVSTAVTSLDYVRQFRFLAIFNVSFFLFKLVGFFLDQPPGWPDLVTTFFPDHIWKCSFLVCPSMLLYRLTNKLINRYPLWHPNLYHSLAHSSRRRPFLTQLSTWFITFTRLLC